MRTTLMIHDELYAEIQRVAAGRRTSVSKIVNDVLRREFDPVTAGSQRSKVGIPVYGGKTDSRMDTSPAEFDALLNDESGV